MTKNVGCVQPLIYVAGAIFGILFLVSGIVATLFFQILPYIIPAADLQRNASGHFIVTSDNYDNWTTYSAVFSRISGYVGHGILDGKFVVRVLPKILTEPPADIRNADNYVSQFYSVRTSSDEVGLINRSDDAAITKYVQDLIKTVEAHNDALVASGFDASADFREPKLPIKPVEKFVVYDGKDQWMKQCVKAGCPVSVHVEYSSSIFDGPNVFFVGSALIIKRK